MSERQSGVLLNVISLLPPSPAIIAKITYEWHAGGVQVLTKEAASDAP